MKKLTLYFFLFACLITRAQHSPVQFKQQAFQENPTLNLDKKLILIADWKLFESNDEVKSQVAKTVKVYERAKLKDGNKGIVVFLICKEEDVVAARVALMKSDLTSVYMVTGEDTGKVSLMNDKEEMVKNNMSSSEIFKTVNDLITR